MKLCTLDGSNQIQQEKEKNKSTLKASFPFFFFFQFVNKCSSECIMELYKEFPWNNEDQIFLRLIM